jgi:hypothetical protein
MSTRPDEPFPQRLEHQLEHELERAEEWVDEEVVTVRRTMHRDLKLQMRWLILALVAACGLGVGLGWGQARSSFHRSGASFSAIEATLKQQGLRICSRQSVPVSRVRGAVAAEAYVLGFHTCPSATSGRNLLAVYQFNSSSARDGAALGFLGARGRAAGFGAQGSVWTYGPFMVMLSGQRSDIVDELTHSGLKDLGAS